MGEAQAQFQKSCAGEVEGGSECCVGGGTGRLCFPGSSLSNSLLVTITVAVVACIAAMAVAGAIVAWFCRRRKKISGLCLPSVPLVISSYLVKALTPNIARTLIFGLENP